MRKYLTAFPILGILTLSSIQSLTFAQESSNPLIRDQNTNTQPTSSSPSPSMMPSTGPSPTMSPNTTANSSSITLTTAQGVAGEYLTDSKGRAVYVFDKDKPKDSICTGPCAEEWMPVTVPVNQNAIATGHVSTPFLGNFQRSDGSTQVTYNDKPLYYFKSDEGPGDTKGQGVSDNGGNWFLVKPDGSPLVPAMSQTPHTVSGISSASADTELSFLVPTETVVRDRDRDHDHDHDHGHGYNHDCYYWGTCYGNGGWNGGNCGYYTCYYNGYCCNYCGSCYYQYQHY